MAAGDGSNNGSGSYQKRGGPSGAYQAVDGSDFEDLNSNDGSAAGAAAAARKRWRALVVVGAAVAAAALGLFYYKAYRPAAVGSNNQEQISKAIASSGSGLQVKSNGKLKLFDSLSK
jgi:hypothetical protein